MEKSSAWKITGIYNEGCASEGHCPYYFGRDKEGGCRYFEVWRIREGRVKDVDLSGITVIYVGDILHPAFRDLMKKGSEGGIYISDTATIQQRKVLDSLVISSLGAVTMKKNFGVKYTKIETKEDENSIYFKMPYGEMKQQLTKGPDGTPVRLENQTSDYLTNVKTAHTPFWTYEDHGRLFDYKNRCGTQADFAFKG
jgi:hypothetical protein